MPESLPDPVDLDLRLVRCFTAVAEYRHFGRAAQAQHTTQPSLSRQIRRLEHQLSARLIDRSPQGSRLTQAGETFLPLAKKLLRSANQAVTATQAAAQPSRITIGYLSGLIVTPAVRELRHRHPDADVHVQHIGWDDPRTVLFEYRADAVVTRLPFPTDGLRVTILYDEPRSLLIPTEHRLAGKKSVTLGDITGEPMLRVKDFAAEWHTFWRAEPRPDGRPVPDGAYVDNIEDKFEAVASGQAVVIVPSGIGGLRPDLTLVPLEDIEPSRVVLATRARDHNRVLAAFTKHAQTHITGPGSTGQAR
ncbi:LysR family transcriptional regulator [Amycolatopsis antarctica]|uniref:LysR family transcriptional regulator n=2 Tax=Amycolatopsis antarctica TaxID=1854586 RepID=A0A263CW57_9PSEU|nr:LysR family transcriptional regulator [Amycolatopsis antarctica]